MFTTETMIEATATAAVSMHTTSWGFIARAAFVIHRGEKVEKTKGLLSAALSDKGLTDGSIKNYLSKAQAVAKHLPECKLPPVADESETFDEYMDRVVGTVRAFWGDCNLNGIKMNGPGAVPGKARASKATADTTSDANVPAVEPNVPMPQDRFFAALGVFLSVADNTDLSRITAMVKAEQDKRATEAAAPVADVA